MQKNKQVKNSELDSFTMKNVFSSNQYLSNILAQGDQYLSIEISDETKTAEVPEV